MPTPFGVFRRSLPLVGLTVFTSVVVQAAPIAGTLKIGGEVEVTLTTMDFSPYASGPAVDGTGRVIVTNTIGTGVFSPLTFGEQGTIQDRTIPPQPAGIPISVQNWLVFDDPTFRYALDLTMILPGAYSSTDCFAAPMGGQTCTPDAPPPFVSPYNLSNFIHGAAGLSSNATYSVRGTLRNLDTGSTSIRYNGILGAEFLGQSYQEVLQTLLNGGSVLASYSGTLQAEAVPEPSTAAFALIGAAALLIGRWHRR